MHHALNMAGTELLGGFLIAASAIATGAVSLMCHMGRVAAIPALAGGAARLLYERFKSAS